MDTMKTIVEISASEAQFPAEITLGVRFKKLVRRLSWSWKINNSRFALSNLTDDQLADIGVSRHEAEREARRIRLF